MAVAKQWIDKQKSAATDTQAIIEEVLEECFYAFGAESV
jgi:hypothetical protein